MAGMDNIEYLTTAQVAARLGKPHRTIIHWASIGRLPVAARLPGKTATLLFEPAMVDKLAETVTCPACILHAASTLYPTCDTHS